MKIGFLRRNVTREKRNNRMTKPHAFVAAGRVFKTILFGEFILMGFENFLN
jgi:hypothetical protein